MDLWRPDPCTAAMGNRSRHPRIPSRLTTDRLILRPFRPEDTKPYLQMYRDREVWRFIPPGVWRDGGRKNIPGWRQRNRSGRAYHFIIRTREGNEFVGEIAIFGLDWDWRNAELGYHLNRPHWGNGFASEAAGALTAWAFETAKLVRLYARPFEANVPSVRLLHTLGFRQAGRRAKWARIGGRWEALLEMDLLKEDFVRPRKRGRRSSRPVTRARG